jgi:hypothetical protein
MRTLLFFTLFLFANVTYSQNLRIKFNPTSLIASTFNMQAEVNTKEKQSFQLGFLYGNLESYGRTISGIGITPEYRFYSDSTRLGLYLAPFVRYFALKENKLPKIENCFPHFLFTHSSALYGVIY